MDKAIKLLSPKRFFLDRDFNLIKKKYSRAPAHVKKFKLCLNLVSVDAQLQKELSVWGDSPQPRVFQFPEFSFNDQFA